MLSFPEALPYDTRTKQPNNDPLTTLIIVDACETCPWFWHEKCANTVGSHFWMIKERHRVKNITDRVMAVHSWQIQDVVRQEPNASASTRGWGAVYGAQTNGHL